MNKPTHEIDAYLDGEPTPEEVRAIEDWVQADKANAHALLAAIRLHQQIGSRLRKDRFDQALRSTGQPATTKDGDAAIQALVELARLHEEGLKQPLDLELHKKQRAQHAHTGQAPARRLKAKLILTGSLAAAIAIAGLTVLVVNLFTNPEAPIAEQGEGAVIVATLTDTHDAQWADLAEGALAPGSPLHAGDKLTLTEGFAEITTNHGAIAIVEAPATIELIDSPNAMRLHAGKLVGICETESSKGFLVRTPHMDIFDVGTKFGVTASEDAVDVSVLVGEVRIERETVPAQRLFAEQSARLELEQSNDELAIRPTTSSSYFYAVPDSSRTTKATSNLDRFPIDVLASGFEKGARPYLDRPLSIQPLGKQGLPKALLGGDVVRVHADARPNITPGIAPLQIELSLPRLSDIYLVMEPQANTGPWLAESYEQTAMRVGLVMDNGVIKYNFSVWKRKQPASGNLVAAGAIDRSMYFAVVVPLE